ncbi:hypothetical protein ACIBJF_44305 [Streptomyces sp. NPDC050743]|uniref:hypothetical protein n=1 Tax=Streptomyces sp. NPDC050743 TaxID=3365634 RepID=UPI00378728E1
MFFDIGPLEIVTLLVLAVILVGPEKLPTTVSNIARNMRRLREFLQSAQADIRAELPAELQGMALEDLNPKSLARKHLLSAEDLTRPSRPPALAGKGNCSVAWWRTPRKLRRGPSDPIRSRRSLTTTTNSRQRSGPRRTTDGLAYTVCHGYFTPPCRSQSAWRLRPRPIWAD